MKGYSKLKKVIISCNIVAILCLIVLDVFASRYVFSPITEYELVVNYGESHAPSVKLMSYIEVLQQVQ